MKNALCRNDVQVRGTQKFMEKEIPIVLGGFGGNQKSVTDKIIAEIHNVTVSDIRKAINRNISRFKARIDFVDLKSPSLDDDLIFNLGYSKQQIIQAQNIYLLSERGYAKLIKIMDTDLAWEIHDKLIDEYFQLREGINPYESLSPELQAIFSIDQKQQVLETRIDNLEDNLHITRSQQLQLKRFANEVIVKTLGSKHSNAYKELSKKAFSEFWRKYGLYFNVASYLDTPKKRFKDALQFINDWEPSRELKYMIIGANSQMSLEE